MKKPPLAAPLALAASAILALAAPGTLAPGALHAQQKPTLTPDDYDKWERLGTAVLSPDGRWLAAGVSRVDDENELRVHSTDSDSVVVVAYGSRPVFSDDAAWLAYAIGVSPDERDRAQESRQPVRNSLGLLNLATGEQETIEEVQSFSISDDGRYLAFRRYKPEDKESSGVDVIVRELATGSSLSFGNVSAMSWQDEGRLLAMTIDADDRIGNSVKLYDPATGRLRSLDMDDATYRALSWREASADLAVLKTYADEAFEDTAHVALAWRNLDADEPQSFVLDPREGPALPEATRVVEHRAPSWSEDGATVFLGIQDRTPVDEPVAEDEDEEAEEEGDEAGDGDDAEGDGEDARPGGGREDDEDVPGVEIWHSRDVDPVPQQRVRERQLRQVNHIGAWNLDRDDFLQLGGDHADRASIVEGGAHMIARDETPYDVEAMFRQQFYDLYAVDAATAQRSLVRERVTMDYGGSPGGRYVVWFEGEDYWTHDLQDGETRNITGDLDGTFVNLDVTPTREQMPLVRPRRLDGGRRGRADQRSLGRVGGGPRRLRRAAPDRRRRGRGAPPGRAHRP